MKKWFISFVFCLALLLASSAAVSASWWSDMSGGAITGYATATLKVKEQVKCIFKDANTIQKCYSSKGSCSGYVTCTVTVKGKLGEKIPWKSSCGGYAYTTLDGQAEYAEFSCVPVTSSPIVKEQVKCIFKGSAIKQTCYSEKGSCAGLETCVVNVKGPKGEKVTWKSSCGGYAYTLIDGQNEYAPFSCV